MLNLTPHPITLRRPDGTEITFPPSGTLARVATLDYEDRTHLGFPVLVRKFGEVTGLPEEDIPVLVSAMVLGAIKTPRMNTFAPDTGPTAIRENGQVVAVTRLVGLES